MRLPRPRRHVVQVTLIGLCLLVPAAGSFLGRAPAASQGEKRRLASFPAPPKTLLEAVSWSRRFDTWLNDNVGLRRALLTCSSRIKVQILKVPPSPLTPVLIGRDGWLYYLGNRSLESMERTNPFTVADLDAWCRSLEARRRWLQARGARFLFVLAPDKQTVYPEHLPRWVSTPDKPSRADDLLAALRARTTVATLDLRPVLREARKHGRVFQTTDSHWSSLGAYFAYAAVINALGGPDGSVRPRPLAEFSRGAERTPGGDLATMLGAQSFLTEDQVWLGLPEPRKSHQVDASAYSALRVWNEGQSPIVTECENASLGRVVFLRDSFLEALREPLSEHFGRAAYIWFDIGFPVALIEREKPDIVVLEMVERLVSVHIPPPPPPDPTVATGSGTPSKPR